MIIKELIINEEDDLGVYAVSLVSNPAILSNFLYFSDELKKVEKIEFGRRKDAADKAKVNLNDWWVYTAFPLPEVIDTSHRFCRENHSKVFHVSEINKFNKDKDDGFIMESDYFTNFSSNTPNKNINSQIYGCRHYFRRVRNLEEIPKSKLDKYSAQPNEFTQQIRFRVSDQEKREIEGVAMRSGQLIYRKEIGYEEDDGYVYFSRDTIRQVQKKYGFNRTITIEHENDITGTAILLDSWLVEDDEMNKTEWLLKYKVVDDRLWNVIKDEFVVGFSVEGFFEYK